jgi:uncharacterized protein
VLDVRLTPRGGEDAVEGIERRDDGRAVIKVRVRAPPADGEANAALCRLVAAALGVAQSRVEIAGGAASRLKRLHVTGDAAALVAALQRALDASRRF